MGLRLQFWLRWYELFSGYTSTSTAAVVGISFFFGVFPWLGRVRFGGVRGLAFFCFAFCLIFYRYLLGLVWFGLDGMG